MKVEEKPPPPQPEPEAEETTARIPWGQRIRGWALQLLAPVVSLLIGGVLAAPVAAEIKP